MSSQIIVELNQADKENSNVYNDGDYNISLKKPIILNQGDQLQLKSAFIDTRVANTQKINLKGDILEDGTESHETTIGITFGYYKTDVLGSFESVLPTTTYEGYAAYAGGYHNRFTGRAFPAFKEVPTPSNIYLDIVSMVIKFKGDGTTSNIKLKNSDGAMTTAFFKFNAGFTKKYGRFIINQPEQGNTPFNTILINESNLFDMRIDNLIVSNVKSFPYVVGKPTPPKTIKTDILTPNPDLIEINTQPHTGGAGGTREMYTDKIEFKVPSGFYDADAIAEIINKKCSEIDLDGDLSAKSYEISRNPLLKTIQQIRYDENIQLSFMDIDPSAFQVRQFKYATGDGTNTDNLKDLLNYYIGSSQFGLSYNAETQKMEFLQLHNSLYSSKFNTKDDTDASKRGTAVDTTAQPEIRLLRNQTGVLAQDTKYIVNKNCGIYFTNLEPASLWFDEFKFNPNILVGQQTLTKTFINDGEIKMIAPAFLNDGEQITCDESGLDETIIKTINVNVIGDPANYVNGSFQAFDIAQPLLPKQAGSGLGDAGEIIANTTQTLSIIAEEQLGQELQSEGGYFKLEISMNGVLSDLRGFGENRKIQSIISKYYSQASYTSSYAEGSIPFVNNSAEPLYLSDFRVRILDPDNSLSKSVGDKNSIFLEIIKNSN